MGSTDEGDSGVSQPRRMLSRLPTGAKLFLILSAALLPLVIIAIIATLQTSRVADAEARARLRLASDESARAIAIELVGDMTALRSAINALAIDPADTPSCARVEGVFAQQAQAHVRFVITNRAGRPICGEPFQSSSAALDSNAAIGGAVVPERGLVLSASGARGLTGSVFFPQAFLARLGAPSSRVVIYGQTLMLGEETLTLATIPDARPLDRMETVSTSLGIAELSLRTTIRSAPITSSLVVAMLLPVLMWIAAAGIAWFVVDHLLLAPLRRLRTSVANYQPGEVIEAGTRAPPAEEIRELGDTFRSITRTVALHEAGLAEGLVRQTKLTREVHHRVKNNLQVISSLINFHARGAPTLEAAAAYSSIQRRVDALAVVHRNHYAELEEYRGLGLRSVLGELASNLRATAPNGGMGILLDIDNFLVNQDVAVAVAFVVTETVELAMSADPVARIHVSLKPAAVDGRATLRVVSRALTDSDELRELVRTRYGRVIEGLARQLRAQLHHDPLTGAYEITIAVIGRD